MEQDEENYQAMQSLHQLLGDGLGIPYISQCSPVEQLTLFYILANSMLYLYPSLWLDTYWNSNMVYFLRLSTASDKPVLTFPYISAEVSERQLPGGLLEHELVHRHPAVLALGITFLEVVTGTRFKWSDDPVPWQRVNKNNREAKRILASLEASNRRSLHKPISSSVSKAIRACLELRPPSTFPSKKLSDDGPIRRYILACIVHPLAEELREGHNVNVEELHNSLVTGGVANNSADDLHGDHDELVEESR